jgi:hypothetical protein
MDELLNLSRGEGSGPPVCGRRGNGGGHRAAVAKASDASVTRIRPVKHSWGQASPQRRWHLIIVH